MIFSEIWPMPRIKHTAWSQWVRHKFIALSAVGQAIPKREWRDAEDSQKTSRSSRGENRGQLEVDEQELWGHFKMAGKTNLSYKNIYIYLPLLYLATIHAQHTATAQIKSAEMTSGEQNQWREISLQ